MTAFGGLLRSLDLRSNMAAANAISDAMKTFQGIYSVQAIAETALDSHQTALKILQAYSPPTFDAEQFSKSIVDSTASLGPTIHMINDLLELQRDRFGEILKGIAAQRERLKPPNWRGVPTPSATLLEAMLLDEGLALAWVPDGELLGKLFTASSGQERRRIMGRQWKNIVATCRKLTESISDSELMEYRDFALKSADALQAGYADAAQALSANLLETILKTTLDKDAHRFVTEQKARLPLEKLSARVGIVFGGIWGAHAEYRTWQGDRVPRRFTRHASAHAVSNRQYSRINSVIALMHVVAYLKLLESGDLA
ncbi:hypothetical protein [Nocardia niigatensis]